jgi:site-specific DNA-methyltransferase (cytosine-N4-specific)
MTALARARAHQLPWRSGVAQVCVTSPPYWGLRRYGDHPDELGAEDLHRYLDNLVAVFAEVRRLLRDDGLAWINIGDTAAGSGGAGGDYVIVSQTKRQGRRAPIQRHGYRQGAASLPTRDANPFGPDTRCLPARQWCNVPGRLAAALQDDQWRLRSMITWETVSTRGKPMVRPEDLGHANRPGVSSETIIVLAPTGARANWFPDRLIERGDVWHFPPVTGRYQGPAPFPDELPRRCILPSSEPGDLVIDPFHGSGTTGRVARALGRCYAGADLYAGTAPPFVPALPGSHQVATPTLFDLLDSDPACPAEAPA